MKILFTGASSFTGCWFARELATAGHDVVMTFRRQIDQYEGLRRSRVDMLKAVGQMVFGCSFGSPEFMQLIEREPSWDLLCHHAAEASNYKSADFNVAGALQNNTYNTRRILADLAAKGCSRVLLTGSFFEEGEGAGSEGLRALSPYGLSKALTARVFKYYAQIQGMRLGKFVIPNPFGPYEEPRFLNYLVQSWYKGETPSVNTPAYIRDNIHVSLVTKAYADFIGLLPASPGFSKVNPSGYVESQGSFALRFAANMRDRLGLPCELELKRQSEFPEPLTRINTDPVDCDRLCWDEPRAWDELADYYQRLVASGSAA